MTPRPKLATDRASLTAALARLAIAEDRLEKAKHDVAGKRNCRKTARFRG